MKTKRGNEIVDVTWSPWRWVGGKTARRDIVSLIIVQSSIIRDVWKSTPNGGMDNDLLPKIPLAQTGEAMIHAAGQPGPYPVWSHDGQPVEDYDDAAIACADAIEDGLEEAAESERIARLIERERQGFAAPVRVRHVNKDW